MKPLNVLVAAVVLSLAVGPALAGEGPSPRSGELHTAARRLVSRSQATKGGPRMMMLREAKRLERLADDIEAGRAVDPNEIDRALKRAERPF